MVGGLDLLTQVPETSPYRAFEPSGFSPHCTFKIRRTFQAHQILNGRGAGRRDLPSAGARDITLSGVRTLWVLVPLTSNKFETVSTCGGSTFKWSGCWDSNPGPHAPKARTLAN
jgi:hypothetical protein